MSMLLAALAFFVLLFVQGFLLQTAIALTGDPAPRYGRALVTAWLAALVTGAGVLTWKITIGLIIGPPVAGALAVLLGIGLTAAIFKFRLRLGGGHALVVAGIHNLLAWGASAAVWWLVSYLVH